MSSARRSSSSSSSSRQWSPSGHLFHPNRRPASITVDRFIPVRSAMDFDFAHYLLTASRKEREPTKNSTYRALLDQTLLGNRKRIFSFNNIPIPSPFSELEFDSHRRPSRRRTCLNHEAENILDDTSLNLLDWGSNNLLSIALGNAVHLWNALDHSLIKLVTVDEDAGPVTSVRWAADGRHIAVGLNNSHIQLWDASSGLLLRTLSGAHESRVGALDWNNHILTTGGADSKIINNDVRMESNVVQNYQGHGQEVCGLKWCGSGQQLASGGNDNLIHIWDLSMTSNRASNRNPWVYRFTDHKAGVRALAWCPLRSNLLASGGGDADGCIKFWSTRTGACLNSVHIGSQVCALLWSKRGMELLTSCGSTQNQLVLRKYPSFTPTAEFSGHTGQVLYMAQSPDGCTVATASGGMDETLRVWKVYPHVPQPSKDTLFSNFMQAQIR